MMEPALHFSFEYWKPALLALAPMLINVVLFAYVFFYFPHNKLTRLFYFFLLSLCLWQLADFMVRISADPQTAAYWFYLFSPALNFIPPMGLHFVLLFTQKKSWIKNRFFLFLLYAPAFAFFLMSYGNIISFRIVPSPAWRWLAIGLDDVPGMINASWITGCSLLTLGFLLHFALLKKHANANLDMQSKLIAFGFAIPTLVGAVTEFVFPFLIKTEPIPLLSTTLSVFSVCVLIALKKYELLTYAPQRAWPAIMQNIKEGILIVNNEDIIQFANEHFCRMTGYSEAELLHKKANELLLYEHQRIEMQEKIRNRMQLIQEKYEIALRRKDGAMIWCSISGSPYFDRQGNVIGSIGMHADITERKSAENALLESESGLRIFIEESLLSIHVLDPETRKVVYANRAFFNMMQYTQADILEMTVYDFINHPKENVDERIREIISVRSINAGERTWKRKDGKIINVLVTSVCIRRQGKDVVYITAQDITESKNLERSLMQKVRDLNIFIYQVSHDIKGPLSSILGLTNVALKETLEPGHRAYFEMIAQSTKRLDTTLKALLDIIVITQGKLKYQAIELGNEIAEIKRNLNYLPNYSKLTFIEKIEMTEAVITDKAMIIAILQNLVANAINYADLTKRTPSVTFYARKTYGFLEIIIEDNGVGIPEKLQGKIWDMFFRAHELSKGTGLGLSIVYNAVERLGGEIRVESEPGVGSRFIIKLPAVPEHASVY